MASTSKPSIIDEAARKVVAIRDAYKLAAKKCWWAEQERLAPPYEQALDELKQAVIKTYGR